MNTVKLGFATFPCCGEPHMIYASKEPDLAACKADFANALVAAEPGHAGKALHSMLAEIPMLQFMQLAALVFDIKPPEPEVTVLHVNSFAELRTLLNMVEDGLPPEGVTPTHDAPKTPQ